MRTLSDLDLDGNEIQNVVLQNLATPPSSPTDGRLYYDTGAENVQLWAGSSWVALSAAGGGGPTGAAGGALSGEYPDPGIAADAVGSAELADDAVDTAAVQDAAITNAKLAGSIALAKLVTDPLARANHTGTQTAATVSDFATAADARITAQKGAADGLAPLDSGSKVPTSYLPALAITSVSVVASQAAQLALTAQAGDVAIRSDQNRSYIHNGGTAATMADWSELLTPTDAVLSVNGYTGAVTLTKADVGLGSADNTADADKPVSTAQAAANTSDRARANHTGTQLASTVSDFDTQVRTSRLDQMAVPTADVSMNTHKLTGVVNPTGAQDAATKSYVDGLVPSGGVGDATTSVKGVVQLAGDLAGTAASPQIAAGAIVDADVNAAAAIALTKLAVDPLARANHTGTQLAATVSNFDTQVRTSRLDQMAAPTADVAMNTHKLTGVVNPTAAQDAATKSYVDGLVPSGGVVDATTSVKGVVQLAGDLAGTAASPQIAAGAIVDADVNAAAGIATSKINGFDTQVRTSRLDQMAAPTASVPLNSQKITGLLDPTAAQDAATKAYVDATSQGLDIKASVRVATTAAGTLATSFANGQAVDGVTLATGDRILVKNQAAGAENGIYVVAASGAPARATDADTSAEVTPGMFTFVEAGTTNQDSGWTLTTDAPITLGTTALAFVQFSGAGQVTAGAGLTKTGNTLDVVAGDSSLTVAADSVVVAAPVYARANHTGTQTASTISDFDAQVRLSRLDQMAAPTAAVSLNAQLMTNVATPSASTDAANKSYVDSQVVAAGGADPILVVMGAL